MRRLSFVLLLAAACATAGVRPGVAADDDARVRAQLAEADADQRPELLDELRQVDLRRAQAANTVFAYRRFLAEFPVGEEAEAARALLEKLVFAEAEKAGTEVAWNAFLDEFPRGQKAADAREHLGALVIGRALGSADLMLVRHTLGEFPEHELRPRLVRHEDDLAFAKATKDGKDGLARYLAEHPSGVHRGEAQTAREKLERDELIAAEDLDAARARAERADASPDWKAAVASLELALAQRSLDVDALNRLAASTGPEVAKVVAAAKSLADSLATNPLSDDARSAMRDASAGAGLPPRDTLAHALGRGDPLSQVAALEELAEIGDRHDLPVVLGALESRYLAVRAAAVEATRTFAKALPPAVWHELAGEAEVDALTQPFSPASWRRVAALREADGRAADALAAWQEVAHEDPDDVVARERILALIGPDADRLAFSSAARQLAKSAVDFGQGRCLPPPSDDTPPEQRPSGVGPGRVYGVSADVTVLRQLCAAIADGEEGSRALESLRTAAGPSEQELLGLAISSTDDALERLRSRRAELESNAKQADASFVPCGIDPAAKAIASSRASRVAAIARLASLGDARLAAFVAGLEATSDAAVKQAATDAAAKLSAKR